MIRPHRTDDQGAVLILVLMLITVVAIGIAALLSLADTSVVTTEMVRAQAAAAYAADGAGKTAVNGLRTDTFNGASGQCITSGSAWLLPNFYPGTTGAAASSAYVSCTPDSGNSTNNGGATSPNASPGSAILTLGTGAGGEDGIYVSSNSGPIQIRGGVFSDSTINAAAGGIKNTYNNPPGLPYNIARGACVNPSLITPTQYTQCNYTAIDQRGTDPGTLTPHGGSYDPPAAASGNGTIGNCTGKTFQTLTPGRYTSVAALNALTGCSTGVVWFTPGTYYFDFKDSGVAHNWVVSRTYDIAGTPTIPLTTTPTPAQMPTACVAPSDPAATTTSGALFVFGGDSQMTLSHQGSPGGQVTVCASASASGPPIAVYGLKNSLGGSYPVNAESGCVANIPPATTCPVIYTDQSPSTTLTIQGTTYTPRALININLNNSTNQVFRWGLITRSLSVGATGSVNLSLPLIDVPNVAVSPTPSPNIVYLAVYVCDQASTCDASGKLRLRIKVQLSGTTPRTVTVLGWSTQR